ncbi:MAG: thermonuclease family protein [Geminicoccaceae bacterium]|nr:thermonuclease family protein [Geminicoccaceae bacterium]
MSARAARSRRGFSAALAASALAALARGRRPARAAPIDAAVAEVEGPDRLRFGDGRIARLLGYVVPGDLSPAPADLSRALRTKARLAELAAQGLRFEILGEDRYGRLEALARTPDGRLVAELFVEEGLAWAWADGLPAPAGRLLLAAEERARKARRGLWAEPALAEQDARGIAPEPIRFVVAVGRVHRIGRGALFFYVDLGPDRRSDLALRIPERAAPAFRRAGLAPERLEGKRLRVRGWLFATRGPTIETEDPLSVEVLE